MTCEDQLTASTPAGTSLPRILGLASGGWMGSPTPAFEDGIDTASGTYYGFKTYTYVTKSAARRTTIHLLAPEDGLLFYTAANKWNAHLTDIQVIQGATTSVTLYGCGSDRSGYAGELLLKQPGCVRLLISAHGRGGAQQRLNISMGKQC